jgi:hypothetical protein
MKVFRRMSHPIVLASLRDSPSLDEQVRAGGLKVLCRRASFIKPSAPERRAPYSARKTGDDPVAGLSN